MNNSDFEDKLLLASLTRKIFSISTGTPISTISNWFTKRKGKEGKTPYWVEPYLDLYIQNRDNKIHIKKLYEELKKDNKSVKN